MCSTGYIASPKNGFRIGVPVVEGTNLLVERPEMDHPVGEIEMRVPIRRNQHGEDQGLCEGRAIGRDIDVGMYSGAIQVQKGSLDEGPLRNSQYGVKDVVEDLGNLVDPIRNVRAIANIPNVQDPVSESNVCQRHTMIDHQSMPENVP